MTRGYVLVLGLLAVAWLAMPGAADVPLAKPAALAAEVRFAGCGGSTAVLTGSELVRPVEWAKWSFVLSPSYNATSACQGVTGGVFFASGSASGGFQGATPAMCCRHLDIAPFEPDGLSFRTSIILCSFFCHHGVAEGVLL